MFTLKTNNFAVRRQLGIKLKIREVKTGHGNLELLKQITSANFSVRQIFSSGVAYEVRQVFGIRNNKKWEKEK